LWRSSSNQVIKDKTDEARADAVKKGLLSLRGAFFEVLKQEESQPDGLSIRGVPANDTQMRFRHLVQRFFKKYDQDGNGLIDKLELASLLKDLNISTKYADTDNYLKEMDADQNGEISFEEFVNFIASTIINPNGLVTRTQSPSSLVSSSLQILQRVHEGQAELLTSAVDDDEEDDGEDEEEEVPEDLIDLPPDQQRYRILRRSFWMMGWGVLLVTLFSDPIVTVFSGIGAITGIPPFYVAFVLAPIASNASEIIASYFYAKKKTSKTITISLATLMGAAVMNNTFVLGIFLGLVRFRNLQWTFSAETISILFVEIVMTVVVLTRKVHTMRVNVLVLMLFPLSLLLVAILESSFVRLN